MDETIGIDEAIGPFWRDARRWQDRWEAIGPLGEGRHGSTHLARRADGSDPTPRFLKVLKAQHKPQMRRQLAREAAALHILRHPRIPRLVESNAHRHAEVRDHELYLVADHVAGPRLDQAVGRLDQAVGAGHPLGLEAALALADGLLDVVGHCHERDRVHRDIRPENVVLRGGDPADPVLVDFNLAVNWRGATHVSRGWRDHRDPRVDVTQVARLLYYALTGQFRTPLRDWSGLAPHRRPSEYALLLGLGGGRARRLLTLLDRAFALRLEDRFQTAGELRAALREVLRPAGPDAAAEVVPVRPAARFEATSEAPVKAR